MHGGCLPDQLTRWDDFNDRVADLVDVIAHHGVEAATTDALAAGIAGSIDFAQHIGQAIVSVFAGEISQSRCRSIYCPDSIKPIGQQFDGDLRLR